jgi:hypothetical protein
MGALYPGLVGFTLRFILIDGDVSPPPFATLDAILFMAYQ